MLPIGNICNRGLISTKQRHWMEDDTPTFGFIYLFIYNFFQTIFQDSIQHTQVGATRCSP